MPRHAATISEQFHDDRLDYEAAKRTSRFQRRRRGIPTMGAGGDYHYRSESDFLWMGEIARDMYRNDQVLGQLTDRAVVNTIGSGFTPEPDTGDKKLDLDLKQRWAEESVDPDYCDTAGELTFNEQETTVLRDMLVVGDIFATPTPDGTVQLLESHRCRSPHRTTRNMVHGIEMERGTRRRKRAYFTKEEIDPNKQGALKLDNLHSVDWRDADGEANVWHVLHPKRASQTRGVSAYAPVIVPAGMFDDLSFSHLLKSQLNSHYLLVRNRKKGYFDTNPDAQPLGTPSDRFTGVRRPQEIAPGSEIGSGPDETITPWNPNNPPAEFFPHARLMLTIIGCNIGMPLVLVLMDASETNFSGYRGAVDQARMGFRHNQGIVVVRFHRPYWRFKINYWADHDPILANHRAQLEDRFYRHNWNRPGWPYIEPTKDATADLIRDAHMQTSPRRRYAERGSQWHEIFTETIEDRGSAIRAALKEAQAINTEFKLTGEAAVAWRDLAPLPVPERVSVTLVGDDAPEEKKSAERKPANKSAA